MYGKSLQRNWRQSLTGSQIIETPDLLNAMDEINDSCKKETVPNDMPKPKTPEVQEFPKHVGAPVPANKQIETRLLSGKRRIKPMLLTPPSVPK